MHLKYIASEIKKMVDIKRKLENATLIKDERERDQKIMVVRVSILMLTRKFCDMVVQELATIQNQKEMDYIHSLYSKVLDLVDVEDVKYPEDASPAVHEILSVM